jgi:hypothetical protein
MIDFTRYYFESEAEAATKIRKYVRNWESVGLRCRYLLDAEEVLANLAREDGERDLVYLALIRNGEVIPPTELTKLYENLMEG